MDESGRPDITWFNRFSSHWSQGSRICIEFELDDDPPGFGLMIVDAKGEHFAGKISIWCMKEELIALAKELSEMPIRSEPPVEFITNDLTLRFREIGLRKLVRCDVMMRIASEEKELGYIPSMTTSVSVNYSQLKNFAIELHRIANSESEQAIL